MAQAELPTEWLSVIFCLFEDDDGDASDAWWKEVDNLALFCCQGRQKKKSRGDGAERASTPARITICSQLPDSSHPFPGGTKLAYFAGTFDVTPDPPIMLAFYKKFSKLSRGIA